MNQIPPAPTEASVAIIGIGCRFPGGVSDPDSFWQLLESGRDSVTEIPSDRMDIGRYFDPAPATPGRMATRWGGFLQHIDAFDADFFGISPREAERLDPQQRLLLETAWEALEDAGQDVRRLAGPHSGVFVGQWISDFEARLFADPEGVDFLMTTGSGRYAASGRLSYLLGFRGPSLTIDTACSSSLAAVHLAVRSIRSGESKIALAGGANVILQPHISIAYSQSRMMAADGRCKFGDAGGDGYVRSEGVGLVVLKALRHALADGDRIYAVIRGSAINNDGHSSGSLGTPSQLGQEELLRAAYDDAGIPVCQVDYVEAHGTGTRAGDPIELAALGAVLREGREPESRVAVGSVKTNIGHTEGAAGVAGLIKAALALHHCTIPPSLHCHELNPAVPWSSIPCEIVRARRPWPAQTQPRVAGVSAFGIAGSNGHVVLEAASTTVPTAAIEIRRAQHLLPLSARRPDALRALARRYADLLSSAAAPTLRDVCWSAGTRRTALEQRAVFVATDAGAMVDALRCFAANEASAADGVVHAEAKPKIAFVLPGQGAQWVGMGRELLASEPVFRASLESCDQAAAGFVDWSIIGQLAAAPDSDDYRLDRIDVIQPVLVALAIAYAALLRSLGIEADAVVGHSMGEVAAACIAGVLDLEQAMQVVCRRSALMRQVSGQGAMALVELPFDELRARLAGLEDTVAVAASNGPRSSVISGQPAAVQQVMAALAEQNVFCRHVKVDVASHSPQMAPLAARLGADLSGLRPGLARMPIYSTVLGRRAEGCEFGADYWARNLREPVLFSQAVSQMVADGITTFVELGPHPVLLSSVQQVAPSAATIACGRREAPEQASLIAALGGLWSAGYPLDWRRLMPEGGRTVQLPLYPWQRERYWVEAGELRPANARLRSASLGYGDEARRWLYRLAWQPSEVVGLPLQGAPGRWLVAADDVPLGSAIVAALTQAGGTAERVPLHQLAPATGSAWFHEALHGIIVVADETADAAFLPLQVLQSCLAAAPATPRLWFVTRGAQSVAADERVSVEQAALWGAARIIAEEHPNLWGGLIDLDRAAAPLAAGALLAGQVRQDHGEDQIAFRQDRRYVLRLVPADGNLAVTGQAWRQDAAYLITGGLGGIGLHIARAMAEDGARRLILLGRTPLPPRAQWSAAASDPVLGQRIAAVRELEAMGVAVHTPAVDISDEDALRGFLDTYAAEGWPPIRGVIHTAVALDNCLAGAMDRATFDNVLRAKLRGAQALDRLLPALDIFVLFSSIGGFLPHPGVANYAAANAGLDALAQDRRARGLPAQSIAWGPWDNAGLALGEAGEQAVLEMARQGIQAIPATQGAALFAWLCLRSAATIAVMPTDWPQFRKAHTGRPLPLMRDRLADVAATAVEPSALRDALEAAAPEQRRQLLDGAVRGAIGHILKIAPGRLDSRKTFGSMGLSSLMAIELRNRLENLLGCPLSATLAWNYPTIDALIAHLVGDEPALEPAHEADRPEPTRSALAACIDEIAAWSDEDALLALRGQPIDAVQ